jgi:hypothetical protein
MGRMSTKRRAADPLSHPVETARTVAAVRAQAALAQAEGQLSPAAKRHVRSANTAVRIAAALVVRSVHHRAKRCRLAVRVM